MNLWKRSKQRHLLVFHFDVLQMTVAVLCICNLYTEKKKTFVAVHDDFKLLKNNQGPILWPIRIISKETCRNILETLSKRKRVFLHPGIAPACKSRATPPQICGVIHPSASWRFSSLASVWATPVQKYTFLYKENEKEKHFSWRGSHGPQTGSSLSTLHPWWKGSCH